MAAQHYDLVFEGGRVMDPETGLDAVRNVGIRAGKIVRMSSHPLTGRRVVPSTGLVVAPGFMPAQLLERSTPAGRPGSDADIVVFDPETIADRSTFRNPMEPSVGVRYLVVGGTLIVDQGNIVPDLFRAALCWGQESPVWDRVFDPRLKHLPPQRVT
jgi:N-acyl-D-aspartate/D-glutamate deacylase